MAQKLLSVFLMCIVVVAATMQVAKAQTRDDDSSDAFPPISIPPVGPVSYEECFGNCKKDCDATTANGSGADCRMKCDKECAEEKDLMEDQLNEEV